LADYSEVTDPVIQSKVVARYGREIAGLRHQGFHHLAYALEALGPLSAIFQLPVLLRALPEREVLVFPSPLRLAVANVLLARECPSTIALCMGMGVKLYTGFGDGTLLISSTFPSQAIPGPKSPIVKPPPSPSIEEAWRSHSAAVSHLEAEGKRSNKTSPSRPTFRRRTERKTPATTNRVSPNIAPKPTRLAGNEASVPGLPTCPRM
jgi:hypothetical protein